LENVNLHKEGHRVVLETNGVPILGDDGEVRGYRGIARDITDRKCAHDHKLKLEEQLHHAQKMEAVGQLAAGVAHDISNLIVVIMGSIEQMRRAMREYEAGAPGLAMIEDAARQVSEITRSLMTFSRKVPASKQQLDLWDVVKESVQLLRRLIPASIKVNMRIDLTRAVWMRGNKAQLQQAIINLGINARDAMPAGGQLSIRLGSFSQEGDLTLASAPTDGSKLAQLIVSDTGTGMPPEISSRVFEPFFTTKEPGHGTGLGLSVVHGIVEDHGGRISVESEVGVGSSFTITLPCLGKGFIRADIEGEMLVEQVERQLVLLAEKHDAAREVMSSSLRSLGYQVIDFGDGESFLQAYDAKGMDLCLLIIDANLSKDSGLYCLERIRNEGCEVPAIVTVDEPSPDLESRLDEYSLLLGKPFQICELVELVRNILRLRTDAGIDLEEV
jgi:signal transduction histidine kinase